MAKVLLFKTPLYVEEFARRSKGIGTGFNRLYTPDFGGVPIAVPPLSEQQLILEAVEAFNHNVSRLIHTKRRLITLLNEQKQAIIHQAMTGGLDPNVKLRPSGTDWLPGVPEHWEVAALRRFWDVIDCKHLTVPFVDEGRPLASVAQVQSFDLDLSDAKKTTEEWYFHLITGGRKPQQGDLIYCRNVSVGACAYVNTIVDFAMGQDVCLIRSRYQNQRYLNHFLRSWLMKDQLSRILVGSTFKRINISDINALLVLVPPRSEQDAITAFLDEQCEEINVAITRIVREIGLIREYRTRLINDVVTGKLDVRDVELPTVDDDGDLAPLADELADDLLGDGDEMELIEEGTDAD